VIPAQLLAMVPGCESGTPPQAVQRLDGAAARNAVWRIRTGAGEFVLRQRLAPIDRPGSSAVMELASHRVAAATGLAPRIIHAEAGGAWLLMEHVAGDSWSEAQLRTTKGLQRLAAVLTRVHALPLPAGCAVLDATAVANAYMAQLRGMAGPLAQQLQDLPLQVAELSQAIDQCARPPVLNHGDLTLANVIGDAPILVDWEYAQIADATWDVACLLTYYPWIDAHLHEFMAALRLGRDDDFEVLRLQMRRFGCLNALWEATQPPNAG
jgi:thiamine kinase